MHEGMTFATSHLASAAPSQRLSVSPVGFPGCQEAELWQRRLMRVEGKLTPCWAHSHSSHELSQPPAAALPPPSVQLPPQLEPRLYLSSAEVLFFFFLLSIPLNSFGFREAKGINFNLSHIHDFILEFN